MAAPTQIGELKTLGLQAFKYARYSSGSWAADGQSFSGGTTYSGMVVESVTVSGTAEEEEHRNEDAETATIVLENPGSEISVEVVMLDVASDPTFPPAVGTIVILSSAAGTGGDAFRVTSAPVTLGRGKEAVKISFTAKREDSMSSIYDA